MPQPKTATPVKIISPKQRYYLYDLIEFEVRFSPSAFLLDQLEKYDPYYRHDAYDADEDYTMFRAEAVFECWDLPVSQKGAPPSKSKYMVPVYAIQEKRGSPWKWKVRFQPTHPGRWRARIWALCWQPGPNVPNDLAHKGTKRKAKKSFVYTNGSAFTSTDEFYEFSFGAHLQDQPQAELINPIPTLRDDDYKTHPQAEAWFSVQTNFTPKAGFPMGPLRKSKNNENIQYMYRSQFDPKAQAYTDKPFFLTGVGRPWVVRDPKGGWQEYLDREKDLFQPMQQAGCNLLSHWMAPWETQLVHQAVQEFWHKGKGIFSGHPADRLQGTNRVKGYRRFDQGRAKHTDQLFDQAKNYDVILLFSIFTHQSLEDYDHPWPERGWGKRSGVRDKPQLKLKGYGAAIQADKANGFQLFTNPSLLGTDPSISIEDFFSMDPASSQSWQRQLWLHFANYWRYILARWAPHPALGAWVIVDEFEGVGTSDNWWWQKKQGTKVPDTYKWHDRLMELIKEKMRWSRNSWQLPYTGDYLQHPTTSSTTHYQGTNDSHSNLRTPTQALQKLDTYGETKDYLHWLKNKKEPVDFASHHVYQMAPSPGEWQSQRIGGKSQRVFQIGQRKNNRFIPRTHAQPTLFSGWYAPNGDDVKYLNTDRWFWDSFYTRVYNWSQYHKNQTRLVTEFGAAERDKSSQRWDFFGKRFPAYMHIAVWTGLMLGNAGIPIKWNDGKDLGEMSSRPSHSQKTKLPAKWIWSKKNYPVDNYEDIKHLLTFIEGIDLEPLQTLSFQSKNNYIKAGVWLQQKRGSSRSQSPKLQKNLRVWGLVHPSAQLVLIWIHDRTHGSSGSTFTGHVSVEGLQANRKYDYYWFNTWEGHYFKAKQKNKKRTKSVRHTIQTDRMGKAIIPMIEHFPIHSRGPSVAFSVDENDVALHIEVHK